ncbi:MAG: hypothetical protein JOZ05_17880 [Acetobacteraceae bacterium]|nr:hypothetical protein [Acetobacteraceae bacterium]
MSPISRRAVFGGGAALLAAPALATGDRPNTLRIVPEADLTILDPIWTTANPEGKRTAIPTEGGH